MLRTVAKRGASLKGTRRPLRPHVRHSRQPEYRAALLIRREVANDRRVERYWNLIATISGRPPMPSLAPVFDWFIAALRHHPEP